MPLKIVYLDDEIDLCSIFEDEFASNEISIQTFTNPTQAMEYVAANSVDLIFLDYRLPHTNGDKVAFAMNNAIPKCLVTGELDLQYQYKFLQVFSKPWDRSAMADLIARYLK